VGSHLLCFSAVNAEATELEVSHAAGEAWEEDMWVLPICPSTGHGFSQYSLLLLSQHKTSVGIPDGMNY